MAGAFDSTTMGLLAPVRTPRYDATIFNGIVTTCLHIRSDMRSGIHVDGLYHATNYLMLKTTTFMHAKPTTRVGSLRDAARIHYQKYLSRMGVALKDLHRIIAHSTHSSEAVQALVPGDWQSIMHRALPAYLVADKITVFCDLLVRHIEEEPNLYKATPLLQDALLHIECAITTAKGLIVALTLHKTGPASFRERISRPHALQKEPAAMQQPAPKPTLPVARAEVDYGRATGGLVPAATWPGASLFTPSGLPSDGATAIPPLVSGKQSHPNDKPIPTHTLPTARAEVDYGRATGGLVPATTWPGASIFTPSERPSDSMTATPPSVPAKVLNWRDHDLREYARTGNVVPRTRSTVPYTNTAEGSSQSELPARVSTFAPFHPDDVGVGESAGTLTAMPRTRSTTPSESSDGSSQSDLPERGPDTSLPTRALETVTNAPPIPGFRQSQGPSFTKLSPKLPIEYSVSSAQQSDRHTPAVTPNNESALATRDGDADRLGEPSWSVGENPFLKRIDLKLKSLSGSREAFQKAVEKAGSLRKKLDSNHSDKESLTDRSSGNDSSENGSSEDNSSDEAGSDANDSEDGSLDNGSSNHYTPNNSSPDDDSSEDDFSNDHTPDEGSSDDRTPDHDHSLDHDGSLNNSSEGEQKEQEEDTPLLLGSLQARKPIFLCWCVLGGIILFDAYRARIRDWLPVVLLVQTSVLVKRYLAARTCDHYLKHDGREESSESHDADFNVDLYIIEDLAAEITEQKDELTDKMDCLSEIKWPQEAIIGEIQNLVRTQRFLREKHLMLYREWYQAVGEEGAIRALKSGGSTGLLQGDTRRVFAGFFAQSRHLDGHGRLIPVNSKYGEVDETDTVEEVAAGGVTASQGDVSDRGPIVAAEAAEEDWDHCSVDGDSNAVDEVVAGEDTALLGDVSDRDHTVAAEGAEENWDDCKVHDDSNAVDAVEAAQGTASEGVVGEGSTVAAEGIEDGWEDWKADSVLRSDEGFSSNDEESGFIHLN